MVDQKEVFFSHTGGLLVPNVRVQLLALTLLESILPECSASSQEELIETVTSQLFCHLSDNMWKAPFATAKEQARKKNRILIKGYNKHLVTVD